MTSSAVRNETSAHAFPPVTDRPIRLGVLISGGGTTLLNFLDQIRQGRLNAEVSVVIASQKNCKGVDRALAAGLKCQVIRPRDFRDVDEFSHALFNQLRAARVDLVTMAGFLSLLHIPNDYL
jgi:folate-dependent phosphoribosylglycinamide formyltransferase PurN